MPRGPADHGETIILSKPTTVYAMSMSSSGKRGALIFLHGLGDSPAGWSQLEYMLPEMKQRLKDIVYVFPPAPTIPSKCYFVVFMRVKMCACACERETIVADSFLYSFGLIRILLLSVSGLVTINGGMTMPGCEFAQTETNTETFTGKTCKYYLFGGI